MGKPRLTGKSGDAATVYLPAGYIWGQASRPVHEHHPCNELCSRRESQFGGCTPKHSKIPSKWISDFHSLVQPSFADIGSIFTATIPFVAEELRSISMRCWQTWHWKKATKGSLKPSNYGFDPIRPRNVMTNCLTEFSRVWAYNPKCGATLQIRDPSILPKGRQR